MKRREFVTGITLAAGASACSADHADTKESITNINEVFEWNMATSWPPHLPGLGVGADNLAKNIEKASNGRLKIKVYAGGEIVPPLEVFDAVSQGTVQMGHDSSYYHRGKLPAAPYFTTVPFGLNVNEMNAWLYFGGGMELWQKCYKPFDLVPFPVGNTGVQMLGWFNREINTIDDIVGLKIRMPGLGGEIMQRAGAIQVTMAGSEIFTSLQTGAIDAAEWVGPYNDLAFGFQQVAKYYYYPGWHEGGPTLECIVNKDAYNELPEDLKAIVDIAASATNDTMLAEFMARNAFALQQIKAMEDIKISPFPKDVMRAFKKSTQEIINEIARRDERFAKVYKSYSDYKNTVEQWTKISEYALLKNRYE